MLRFISRIATCIALVSLISIPSFVRAQNSPGEYVALGDSITFGYNLSPDPQTKPSPLAYPYLVGKRMGYTVLDEAVPGMTSEALLTAVQSGKYDAILKSAKIVTIDIGSNDLLALAKSYLEAEKKPPASIIWQLNARIMQFTQTEAALLQAVKSRTTGQIVLLNLYDPLPALSPLFSFAQTEIGAMNRALSKDAAADDLPLLDVYNLFDGRQFSYVQLLYADVHPTASGQGAIAGLLENALSDFSLQNFVPERFGVLDASTPLYSDSSFSRELGDLQAGTVVRINTLDNREGEVSTPDGLKSLGFVPEADFTAMFVRDEDQLATFDVQSVTASLTAISRVVRISSHQAGSSLPAIKIGATVYLPLIPLAQALGYRTAWSPTDHAYEFESGQAPHFASGKGAIPAGSKRISIVFDGIGLMVDGAFIATPTADSEPFLWRGNPYVSMNVLSRMFYVVPTFPAS